jgi:DNA invertase Pin-like site-specific DNA recombinase
MKTAAAYARVSSDKQSETSIDAQFDEIERLASTSGIQVKERFWDKVSASGEKERPSFDEMIRRALLKEFNFIIVYKSDRFNRDAVKDQQLREELEKRGVYVLSVKDPADPTTPAGRLQAWIFSGLNRFYLDNLKQELYTKNTKVAEQGFFMGGTPPYGYAVKEVRDKEASRNRKVYVLNLEEVPIVVTVYDMYANGHSLGEIVAELNAKGYKTRTGKAWARTSIYEILHNKRYAGIYTYRGKKLGNNSHAKRTDTIEVPGVIPPIVLPETFERVKARWRTNITRAQSKHDHILTGIIYCGVCGASMGLTGGQYPKYQCSRWANSRDTQYVSAGAKTADKRVIGYIKNVILNEPDFELIAENYNKERALSDIALKSKVEAITAKLDEINAGIDNAVSAILKGILSDKLEGEVKRLEAKKKKLNEELLSLSQSTGRRITTEEVRNIYTRYEEMLNSDITEQRALVLDLIERVEVFPEGFMNIVPK